MANSLHSITGKKVRPIGIIMEPTEANEAKGVTIRRTIGSEKLVLLDPFLLLDHLEVTLDGETNSLGFPRHPHRGIETLTYVFSGRVHHRDSLGNDSGVGANGSQWMTAGGGIFHEEMLEAVDTSNKYIEALQIWFNLPAADKMVKPSYEPARAEDIPVVSLGGEATARVVAGEINGVSGPFKGIAVKPTYADVTVPSGTSITLEAPSGNATIAYLYRGNGSFGEEDAQKTATAPRLIIFAEGDIVNVTTTESEARFIFVSAAPLQEPVLQYRSLVLNTVDQMRQAISDLENGTFAQ